MNSIGIKRVAIGVLGISFLGFFFSDAIPVPMMGKFFLGGFGFGTGAVLLIVANILKIKGYESRSDGDQTEENPDDDEDKE